MRPTGWVIPQVAAAETCGDQEQVHHCTTKILFLEIFKNLIIFFQFWTSNCPSPGVFSCFFMVTAPSPLIPVAGQPGRWTSTGAVFLGSGVLCRDFSGGILSGAKNTRRLGKLQGEWWWMEGKIMNDDESCHCNGGRSPFARTTGSSTRSVLYIPEVRVGCRSLILSCQFWDTHVYSGRSSLGAGRLHRS